MHSFDCLVVGAGPAGLAAACTASESGLQVGVVDDNPWPGGQIWRGKEAEPRSVKSTWLQRLQRASPTMLHGVQVIGASSDGALLAHQQGEPCRLEYRKLIIATGARELFLPFPGWTLPGVMGAGGMQAMVKSGMPVRGKRVVVAGTGPLLLAVAGYLRKQGAEVAQVLEQAPNRRVMRFGLSLLWHGPGKLWQGIRLRKGLPYRTGAWVTQANGSDALQSITWTDGSKTVTEPCDYLACGFGLVPNVELASLLGCLVRNGRVYVDTLQCARLPGHYCAGEPTGIGGLELSLIEGQIAGFAAGGMIEAAQKLFRARARAWKFAKLLEKTFTLREELKHLAEPDTLVCRCEDISFSRLQAFGSWREAKLQSRCGMGPCQGRICGGATGALFGWAMESVRPPILPAPVGAFLYSDQEASGDSR